MAADAETQLALYPPFVCCGDELVLDWADAMVLVREEGSVQFTAEADRAISELDRRIDVYSGRPGDGLFCDPAALRNDPRWGEMRALAAAVCVACGWTIDPPWSNCETYVRGSRR